MFCRYLIAVSVLLGESVANNDRLDHQISCLSQYTREAQWRLELISGFDTSTKSSIIGTFCTSFNNIYGGGLWEYT